AIELPAAKSFYAEMKARVKNANRDPDSVQVLPGLYVYLGSTVEEAKRALAAQSSTAIAGQQLAVRLSTAVEKLTLDESGPAESLDQAQLNPKSDGHTRAMVELFRRERLTIREFLERQPVRGPHRVLVGVPETIAEALETWFLERAADGFNLGNLTHES